MKIHLKNVGMLDEATFEVGALTIICGENNTGKTYATYSLYGYLDYMRKIRERLFSIERRSLFDNDDLVEAMVEDGEGSKKTYEEIKERLEKHIKDKTKTYANRSPRSFIGSNPIIETMAGKREDFSNVSFDVEFNISLDDIKKAVKSYLEDENLNRSYKRVIRHTLYDDGLSLLGLNSRVVIDEYITIFLDALLHIILMKNFILSVERTGASIFKKQLDFMKLAKFETIERMLQKDKIRLLEVVQTENREKQLYPQPVRDNINFTRDIDDQIVSKKESMFKRDKDKYKILFDILSKLVGGKYKVTDFGILFQPKGSKKAYNIEVASSSVRSLLMLYFYIFHIAGENDILMIDEPELNLHPSNQILMGRLIALLVNYGVKVFITTHSDYIVREISNCIMLDNIPDEEMDKFKKRGYFKECKLKSSKVKAYLAQNIRAKNTMKEVKITQEQGIFMETFDEPIESQNDNQGFIFEEVMKHKKSDNDK